MTHTTHTARLLLDCEQQLPVYGDPLVRVDSRGSDVLVVSDLHLAGGLEADGNYGGTENFFGDASFKRFLEWAGKEPRRQGALLVINGDFVDYLRILYVTFCKEEYEEWSVLLERLGIHRTPAELQSSISRERNKYGLKTHDYASVWRLRTAAKGHAGFFDALAGWLRSGNRIAIVKGNHDLEWYWPAVRNCFRLILADRLGVLNGTDSLSELKTRVIPGVVFADKALVVDQSLYIEHGHCYDSLSCVKGDALLARRRELNLPLGSMLGRYIINKVETAFPFVDNIRPRTNVLLLLFRDHFLLAIRVLLQYPHFLSKAIPKRSFWCVLPWFLPLALALPALLLLVLGAVGMWVNNALGHSPPTFIPPLLASPTALLVGAGGLYLLVRFVAGQLVKEPDSLATDASDLFAAHPDYRHIVFGHTHNPEIRENAGRRYLNTGTWIPIVETSGADIRQDKTFTFAQFRCEPSGELQGLPLQRWNDDAGRAEPLALVRRL